MSIKTLFAGLRTNRPLLAGLVILFAGILLSFIGITAIFLVALVFVLAIGVPYPSIFRSLMSRLVASFLLSFSVIQIAASVQFFVAPSSGFPALCLLTGLIGTGLVLMLYGRLPKEQLVFWDRKDAAAVLAVACFIIPFTVLCFWKNDTTNITAFASAQSMDGSSHYIAITEMGGTQHLNYQTAQYYPKGFHIAQALVMNAVHTHQGDQTWEMNARTYVLTYIAWGALLMYVVFYLACRFLAGFFNSTKQKLPAFLVAATIGPVIAFLYLLPFAHEGFLNYYAVCASVVLGVLFLLQYQPKEKSADWFMVAYLLLAFSVTMSWGPLLAPLLLVVPILYLWQRQPGIRRFIKYFANRSHWWVLGGLLLQLVPLYFHFKYAHLTPAQGPNATGGITAFHFGVVLAGIAVALYVLLSKKFSDSLKQFTGYLLVPFVGLVVLFVAAQYIMVGEIRYYAIKISYLLELLLLAFAAALLIYEVTRSGLEAVQRWLVVVVVFGASVVLLLGLTANPFAITRDMFNGFAHLSDRNHDLVVFSQLGREGKLGGTNTVSLHVNPETHKLEGNALISNWANLMQHNTDSTPASASCSGKIFTLETFSVGAPDEQAQLITAVRDCITQANMRNRQYFIVTDAASAGQLREIFGDTASYVY
jgi:hypothetical protein